MSREDFADKEYRALQKARRIQRLPIRQAIIMSLRSEGYRIVKLTEYHFRINDRLDIYPLHHRFHDIKKGTRGGYPRIDSFVKRFFERVAVEENRPS